MVLIASTPMLESSKRARLIEKALMQNEYLISPRELKILKSAMMNIPNIHTYLRGGGGITAEYNTEHNLLKIKAHKRHGTVFAVFEYYLDNKHIKHDE